MPSVGITAYGGEGDDTIIGSQTGDHLAGGSGDDLIVGQRGIDHIYGDSGVTVDVLTRTLYVPTVNTSVSAQADEMIAGEDVLHGEGAGSLVGGPDDGDDVIFGDHGVVTQQVPAGRTDLLGPPLFVRLQTTRLVLVVETAEPQNGADDVITGDTGEDRIGGGNGDDRIEGNDGLDTIFGDHGRIEHDTPDGIIRLVTTTDPLVPAGDDVISGDAERDVILGGNGRDVITGDGERDVILGDHGLLIDRTDPSTATANGTWDVITTTRPEPG